LRYDWIPEARKQKDRLHTNISYLIPALIPSLNKRHSIVHWISPQQPCGQHQSLMVQEPSSKTPQNQTVSPASYRLPLDVCRPREDILFETNYSNSLILFNIRYVITHLTSAFPHTVQIRCPLAKSHGFGNMYVSVHATCIRIGEYIESGSECVSATSLPSS
jgi:hypothetical protein